MLYLWRDRLGLYSTLTSDAGNNEDCRQEIAEGWDREFPEYAGYSRPINLPRGYDSEGNQLFMPPMQVLNLSRFELLKGRGFDVLTDQQMQDLVDNYSG